MTPKERHLLLVTAGAVVAQLGILEAKSYPGLPGMVTEIFEALNAVEYEEVEREIERRKKENT